MKRDHLGVRRKRLDELIEEAISDSNGPVEEHTGLMTMIEENVVCPFRARVIGEEIEVTALEWPSSGYGLVAVCTHKGNAYRIDITSLEWVKPLPRGFEWIAALLAWQDTL